MATLSGWQALGQRADDVPQGTTALHQELERRLTSFQETTGNHLSVVALLPDPLDSFLAREFDLYFTIREWKKSHALKSAAYALLIVLLLVVFYVFSFALAFNPSERSLELSSGVSPTLPALLLIGVLLLWVLAGALRCKSFSSIKEDIGEAPSPALIELVETRSRVRPSVERLLEGKFLLLLASVLVVPSLYLIFYFDDYGNWSTPRLVRGIEEPWLRFDFFDFGISILLVIAVILAAEAGYRQVRSFSEFRQVVELWLNAPQQEDL